MLKNKLFQQKKISPLLGSFSLNDGHFPSGGLLRSSVAIWEYAENECRARFSHIRGMHILIRERKYSIDMYEKWLTRGHLPYWTLNMLFPVFVCVMQPWRSTWKLGAKFECRKIRTETISRDSHSHHRERRFYSRKQFWCCRPVSRVWPRRWWWISQDRGGSFPGLCLSFI